MRRTFHIRKVGCLVSLPYKTGEWCEARLPHKAGEGYETHLQQMGARAAVLGRGVEKNIVDSHGENSRHIEHLRKAGT